LLLAILVIVSGEARRRNRNEKEEVDDESIQAFVFQRAKSFGYGLRYVF